MNVKRIVILNYAARCSHEWLIGHLVSEIDNYFQKSSDMTISFDMGSLS